MPNNEYNNRPSWDKYWMSKAIDAATRASCLYIHAGAVVVKNNREISTGYNGAPPGNRENCLDIGCRKDQLGIAQETKGKGKCRGTHAESNALLYADSEKRKGATLYTVILPCSHCAKDAAAGQIARIVYAIEYKEQGNGTDETEGDVTRGICRRAGIKLEHLAMEEEIKLQNQRRQNIIENNFRTKT
ncbi:MAG: deaminase [archaeon]